MHFLCVFLSYLVIVKTSGDNILRFNVETKALNTLKGRGNYPQDVSVDAENGVVYWVNFQPFGIKHNIMSTSYAGETTDLNITYTGIIEIAQDVDNLYVLDVVDEIIYKYNKRTWGKMGSIEVPSGTRGIEVAFGKYLEKSRNHNLY